MINQTTEAAWEYHNATKHSPSSVRANTHRMDWSIKPLPFKIYPKLETIRLDRSIARTEIPALVAVSAIKVDPEAESAPDLKQLGQLLYLSAGVTKKVEHPGGTQYFRAASCTGALYAFELYIVCGDLDGLDAGVYHFGSGDSSLRRLREGDYRGVLAGAAGSDPAIVRASAILICTGTYWRNAWKYQARTYRHFGWDNGTILANMLAVAEALGLPAQVTCGFVDAEVNRLLDLDTEHEVAFSMIPLGRQSVVPSASPTEIPSLSLETVPLSESEAQYPQMTRMHEASSLGSIEEVVAWRGHTPVGPGTSLNKGTISLLPPCDSQIPKDSIETVVLRRGSTRQFDRVSIEAKQLGTMLHCATRGIWADFLSPFGSSLNDVYLIVNAVDGIKPGAYVYHHEENKLELLKEGDFRGVASHLGLDQSLPGDASVAVFFLADLAPILQRFGNRGYRAVQLEAGILGGKLYLGAYAQRLGATGLTFYDDEVIEFFSPHAAGKSAIFLMALGKSVKRG